MANMLHVTSSTTPGRTTYLAPIADHSREEKTRFYDYHRVGLLALATLYTGRPIRDGCFPTKPARRFVHDHALRHR